MEEKDIDWIAHSLSLDLRDEFNTRLREVLYEHNSFEVEMGFVDPNEPKPDPTIDEKLQAAVEELKRYTEKFTVQLIKQIFFDFKKDTTSE